MKINITWQNSLLALSGVLVVFVAGVAARHYNIVNFPAVFHSSEYRHLNAELAYGSGPKVDKRAYATLKQQLLEFIQQKKKEKIITDASIYFRDLQSGPTLGINEHSQFSPASLLKLPLLLTYYNLREDQPDLFDTQVIYKGFGDMEKALTQRIPPENSLRPNTAYSIKDLTTYMIRYSDNASYYCLLEYLRRISPEMAPLRETFSGLGIIDPKDFFEETISVKIYGSIFVQLFNSSFFNKKEASERALKLLTEPSWKKGLNAGVPPGIEVAHKFGEREGFVGGAVQLHDCGIVYYPQNPYLLCVMTRGHDIDKLSGTIASISKMVYEEFDSRKL